METMETPTLPLPPAATARSRRPAVQPTTTELQTAGNDALLAKAAQIDAHAASAMSIFRGASTLAESLKLAIAIQELRAMLTKDVMAPVMAMMNTPLGFRTDRDPSKQASDGRPLTPYDEGVVKEAFIESMMRGFRLSGNEFNIIAGRFYPTKEGFYRKLTDNVTFPLLSAFKDSQEVPRVVQDRGAVVKCKATWLYNGAPDELECELAIRVNQTQGADAIIGKAQRKLYKRVHDRLAGTNTPDVADADDDTPAGQTINVASTPVEVKKPVFETPRAAPPGNRPLPDLPDLPDPPDRRRELLDVLGAAGLTFRQLHAWMVETSAEPGWDSVAGIDDVSDAAIDRILANRATVIRQLKR